MTTRPGRVAAVAVIGIAALVGCSSGGKPAQHPVTLQDVANKIGCTFIEDTEQHELFTSDQGSCGPYTLYLFPNVTAKTNWMKAAADFGGVDIVKQGDTWLQVRP